MQNMFKPWEKETTTFKSFSLFNLLLFICLLIYLFITVVYCQTELPIEWYIKLSESELFKAEYITS